MMQNKCEQCEYMRQRVEGHCYMFKDEPKPCGAFKAVNVGTIGHVDHGMKARLSLAAAILMTGMNDAND
jgi:hypothetical protein